MKKKFIIVLIILWSAFCFGASQQTSSTLASALVDRAEVILNDTDNEFWTAAQLLTWLNAGMIDIVTRTNCLETTESINLAASTLEYTITSTYLTVMTVHYIDANGNVKALKKSSPMEVGMEEPVGEPVYWYDWAGKIGAFPVLAARTTETLTVYLVTRPTSILASASVTTPAIYDTALVHYMVAQAYLKNLSHGKYAQHMALYISELDKIRAALTAFPPKVAE
jgi:hypothetical protein